MDFEKDDPSSAEPPTERPEEAFVDGRDEMNLVEFPLGVLSDRAPKGVKTLTFEDRLFDRGTRQWIARRLTITASDRFGLPTACDDEVITGLIQLTKEAEFKDRTIPFSRYHLLDLLGWRDEGKNYRRLETSLKRWLGVTLYYEKAWWDNAAKSWVDENFHILERVTIRKRDSGRADAEQKRSSSSFTWNDVVFKSFQAGYLKKLDLGVLRQLELPSSKRMYRFLDKHFWYRKKWAFDLNDFAFEHIGLSRNNHTGEVKRKLMPAFKELEAMEFLEPMSSAERFIRVRRGDWQVVVRRKQTSVATGKEKRMTSVAAEKLVERGVSSGVAEKLVRSKGETEVERQIVEFDKLLVRGNTRALRNPAGFLVTAIREGFVFSSPGSNGVGAKRTEIPVHKAPQPICDTTDGIGDDGGRVNEYLNRLGATEREALEAAAFGAATPFVLNRFDRCRSKGQIELAELYRRAIVEKHVIELLVARGQN